MYNVLDKNVTVKRYQSEMNAWDISSWPAKKIYSFFQVTFSTSIFTGCY